MLCLLRTKFSEITSYQFIFFYKEIPITASMFVSRKLFDKRVNNELDLRPI